MKRKSDDVCTVGLRVHPLYSLTVKYLILILSLTAVAEASDRQPVYWRFPGPLGAELRATLMVQRDPGDDHHLLVNDEVTAYLANQVLPSTLGCLDDTARCQSMEEAVLKALGFGARIVATAQGSAGQYTVKLNMQLIGGAKDESFIGRGATMDVAARMAFSALRGQGTLALTLEPKDAHFLLDGQPFGQGTGEYIVGAGQRVLTVQSPGHDSVQETIRMNVGDRVAMTIRLPVSDGRIRLTTEPVKTRVFIDGEPWLTPAAERSIKAGTYRLKVEADGYFPLEREIKIKAGVGHELTLKLKDKEPLWKKALRRTDDRTAFPWTIRSTLQIGSLRDGVAEYPSRTTRDLASTNEAIPVVGIGVDLGWRGPIWDTTLIGFGYQSGGEGKAATMTGGLSASLSTSSRLLLKLGWPGVRYTMWRIDLFARTGFAYVIETLEGTTANGEQFVASGNRFVMGTELGSRYAITQSWFAGLSGLFDYWPGQRSAATMLISGGFAFDPERWF
ncbi:MAG: PEGA domain-containing protein [Myxococcota bacterium]|nr:PEGA domain-containing protein [Myxococcota bacterium]